MSTPMVRAVILTSSVDDDFRRSEIQRVRSFRSNAHARLLQQWRRQLWWRPFGWQSRWWQSRCRQPGWRQVRVPGAILSEWRPLFYSFNMHHTLPSILEKAQSSVVRVIVRPKSGLPSVGTGFAVDARRVVTAAHIFLDRENIADILPPSLTSLTEKEEFCRRQFEQMEATIEVQTVSGECLIVEGLSLYGGTDIGVLTVRSVPSWLTPTSSSALTLAEDVLLCGFPFSDGIEPVQWPFAAWRGQVMNHLSMIVGGFEWRPLIRIFATALPGASGAPVLNATGQLVGLLTGQMSWGSRRLAVFADSHGAEECAPTRGSLYVPLPYGYVTPGETIIETIKSRVRADSAF